jgi:hypothetical protein
MPLNSLIFRVIVRLCVHPLKVPLAVIKRQRRVGLSRPDRAHMAAIAYKAGEILA